MPRACALDQATGSSGKQFSGAIGPLLHLRKERANGCFMETVKRSVITHYIRILVGNAVASNAPEKRFTTLTAGGQIIKSRRRNRQKCL